MTSLLFFISRATEWCLRIIKKYIYLEAPKELIGIRYSKHSNTKTFAFNKHEILQFYEMSPAIVLSVFWIISLQIILSFSQFSVSLAALEFIMPFTLFSPKTTGRIFLFSYPFRRLWPKGHLLISCILTGVVRHNRKLDKVRTCLLALLRIHFLPLILVIVS